MGEFAEGDRVSWQPGEKADRLTGTVDLALPDGHYRVIATDRRAWVIDPRSMRKEE